MLTGTVASKGKQCAAYNCASNEYKVIGSNRVPSGTRFFSIPVKDKARVKQWCQLIKRKGHVNAFPISKDTLLCEKHFVDVFIHQHPGTTKYNFLNNAKPTPNCWEDHLEKVSLRSLCESYFDKNHVKRSSGVTKFRRLLNDSKPRTLQPANDLTNTSKGKSSGSVKMLPIIEMIIHNDSAEEDNDSEEEYSVGKLEKLTEESFVESPKNLSIKLPTKITPKKLSMKLPTKITPKNLSIKLPTKITPKKLSPILPEATDTIQINKDLSHMNGNFDSELEQSKRKFRELPLQMYSAELPIVRHIKSTDKSCNHYTGFSTLKQLHSVFEIINAGQNGDHIHLYHTQVYSGDSGARMLSAFDGYILTLVRLRRNFSWMHLAFLFEISESTISAVITKWINFMYKHDGLGNINLWPSTTDLSRALDCIQEKNPL